MSKNNMDFGQIYSSSEEKKKKMFIHLKVQLDIPIDKMCHVKSQL